MRIWLVVALLIASTHASAAPCTTECFVDAVTGDDTLNEGTSPADAFATIAKAIATVGAHGTVRVAPGLYDANITDVPKSVTLFGAQSETDVSSRDPNDVATESIVRSNTGFRVTGAGAQVSVFGFTFQEKTAGLSTGISMGSGIADVGGTLFVGGVIFSGMHIGISATFGVNPSTLAIGSNHFAGGGTGVQAVGDRGAAMLVVRQNRFTGMTGSAVSVLEWTNAQIEENVVESHAGPQPPISIGGCAECFVEDNTITGSSGGNAIRVIGGNGPSTDCVVVGNTITNPTQADGYAIFVGDATGTIIAGNTVTGARAGGIVTNPGAEIADNVVTSLGEPGSAGIYLRGANDGSTVTRNRVTGAAVGIDVDPSAGSTATVVARNAIDGNVTGLTNRATIPVNAACNWWGDASGPSGARGGDGDGVSANVTVEPWLRSADVPNAPCDGLPSTTTTTTSTSSTTTTVPVTLCDETPRPDCTSAARAMLVVKNVADDRRDALVWRWQAPTAVPREQLGDPLAATGYTLCLYDGASVVQLIVRVPAVGTCASKPCWKSTKAGYAYEDAERTPDGVTAVHLRGGARKPARLVVKARGALVGPPALPFALPARAQLVRTDAAVCWEATYASAKKNVAARLRATTR